MLDLIFFLVGLFVFVLSSSALIALLWKIGGFSKPRELWNRAMQFVDETGEKVDAGMMKTSLILIVESVKAFFCLAFTKLKQIHRQKLISWKNKLFLTALLIIAVMAFRYTFPVAAHSFFYETLYLKIPMMLAILVAAPVLLYGVALWSKKEKQLALTLFVLGFWIWQVATGLITGTTLWRVTTLKEFESRPRAIMPDPNSLQFMPLQVAHQYMMQDFNRSESTAELDAMHAVDVNGGFGFVVPITPDGLWPSLTEDNPGVIVFNDNAGMREDQRVKQVMDQPFRYGENMVFLDSMRRWLFMHDLFCQYPEIYYLQLKGDKSKEWVAIAPRIKYRLRLPGVLVPEWGGVSLVYPDGKIRVLNREEALADKSLEGKPIYPRSLVLTYVSAQRYDKGPWSGWFRRKNKIRIPRLPGYSQMPFLVKGTDGRYYHLVAAEPDGDSYALFRLYYVDAYNGKRTVLHLDPEKGFIGPGRALEYVKTVQEYKWVERGPGGSEIGNFRPIEARFIPTNDGLYWMYTVTTKSYTGVSATAIVNGETKEVTFFKNRVSFEHWTHTGTILAEAERSSDKWLELETSLRRAMELQQELKPNVDRSEL